MASQERFRIVDPDRLRLAGGQHVDAEPGAERHEEVLHAEVGKGRVSENLHN